MIALLNYCLASVSLGFGIFYLLSGNIWCCITFSISLWLFCNGLYETITRNK